MWEVGENDSGMRIWVSVRQSCILFSLHCNFGISIEKIKNYYWNDSVDLDRDVYVRNHVLGSMEK